jgi:hypothetical protein
VRRDPGADRTQAETDGDGLDDEVNGHGRIDVADVVWLLDQL